MNNLTPEQLKKSRDEFEKYMASFGCRLDLDRNGRYDAEYVQTAWQGWEARQKTICVELPAGEFYLNRECITQLLQAAGIGV